MIFTLGDGRSFDIWEISSIKDYGTDNSSIELSKLAFTVYFNKGRSIQVCDYYHFTDWSEAKKRLTEIRDQIHLLWEAERTQPD